MGDVADKLDYRQAAALGSTFLSLGAAPEVAASASKAMVRELGIASMQGKRFIAGMKALGLNAIDLEKGIANNAVDTIKTVLGKIKALTKDKQLVVMTQLFGKEFGDDAQKLGLNIDEFIRQLALTQQGGAKGSMQRESDINKNSLSAQYRLLKAGGNNTFADLGETLRQPIIDIIAVAKKATAAFRHWVQENPKLASTLAKVVAITALFVVGMGAVAIAFAAVIGPLAIFKLGMLLFNNKIPVISTLLKGLAVAVRLVGTAFLWAARAMIAHPIIAVATALAMLGIYIWRNWSTLVPKFKALWAVISQYTAAASKRIKTCISDVWGELITLFVNNTLPGQIYKNWEEIKSHTLQVWASIRQAISAKWDEIVADVRTLPAKFQQAGGEIVDSLLQGINDKWVTLKTRLSSLADYLPNWMKPGNTDVSMKTQSGKTVPMPVPGRAGISYAGMYDTGGPIPAGQFGIVGERGPEIVKGPASIIGRRQTATMAAVAALSIGAATPAAAAPLHPFSLPTNEYRRTAKDAGGGAVNLPHSAPAQNIFHITAAPGQSPQDIAVIVSRILDDRERKARARANSRFSDQGDFPP